MSPEETFRYSW